MISPPVDTARFIDYLTNPHVHSAITRRSCADRYRRFIDYERKTGKREKRRINDSRLLEYRRGLREARRDNGMARVRFAG